MKYCSFSIIMFQIKIQLIKQMQIKKKKNIL